MIFQEVCLDSRLITGLCHQIKHKEVSLNDFNDFFQVGKPFVGDKSPSVVKGEFSVNVGRRVDIKQEWESE